MYESCMDSACGPAQVVTLKTPVNDILSIRIFRNGNIDDGCEYARTEMKLSHSADSVCWSCWADWDTELKSTAGMSSDFYIRYKVNGPVSAVYMKDNGGWAMSSGWGASLFQGFSFGVSCDSAANPNQYDPYANMECAVGLQQHLAETVACMFGLPAYYFKVSGDAASADLTFKEYALKSVTAVKRLKIVVKDGQTPSSKPDFADLGLGWQTDWEVDVPKGMFASAFGQAEQPVEGDLVYVPMMRRMWQVSEAYDEKNGSLMWMSTTFRLALTKYQDEAMVDKESGGFDDMINGLVKNKYEDLFGDQETLVSGAEATEPLSARADGMASVYESDSCRKYVSTADTSISNTNTGGTPSLYYKGTLIADSFYEFSGTADNTARVEYQRAWCGDELSLSFIANLRGGSGVILSIGYIKVMYEQTAGSDSFRVYSPQDAALSVTVAGGAWHLIVFRFSKRLNSADLSAYAYAYPKGIPDYKLRKFHYYFDIDNGEIASSAWNSEMSSAEKRQVALHGIDGSVTNVKIADAYIDDVSGLMQQHPASARMLVNDTARPLFGLDGVKIF